MPMYQFDGMLRLLLNLPIFANPNHNTCATLYPRFKVDDD